MKIIYIYHMVCVTEYKTAVSSDQHYAALSVMLNRGWAYMLQKKK